MWESEGAAPKMLNIIDKNVHLYIHVVMQQDCAVLSTYLSV